VVLVISFSVLAWSARAEGRENNSYRAGYVMGFQEEAKVKQTDPSMTAGRYAKWRRGQLKRQGKVPINFSRGLEDGFRDAVRGRTPEYQLDDVDLDRLPPHLHPGR